MSVILKSFKRCFNQSFLIIELLRVYVIETELSSDYSIKFLHYISVFTRSHVQSLTFLYRRSHLSLSDSGSETKVLSQTFISSSKVKKHFR